MLGQVLVYTMNGCPHCTNVKTQVSKMDALSHTGTTIKSAGIDIFEKKI